MTIPDFLSSADTKVLADLGHIEDQRERWEVISQLVIKLSSIEIGFEDFFHRRTSPYLKHFPKQIELAEALATEAGYSIRFTASHDLYIMSFFSQIEIEFDKLKRELIEGNVYINDIPLTVDNDVEDLLDIDGYIIFDGVLVTIADINILAFPSEEYKMSANEA